MQIEGVLRCSWVLDYLTPVCLRGVHGASWRYIFCLYPAGDQLIYDLNHVCIDFPAVLTTFLGANEHSRVRWYQRGFMCDGVDALWAKLLEQGLRLKGIRRAAAEAKERQKSFHTERYGVMAVLVNIRRESEAQSTWSGAVATYRSSSR